MSAPDTPQPQLTDADLDDMQARCDAATPIALMSYKEGGYVEINMLPNPCVHGFTKEIGAFYLMEDAERYKQMLGDMLRLIAEVRSMRKNKDDWQQLAKDFSKQILDLRRQLAEAQAEIKRLEKQNEILQGQLLR